MEEPGRLQTMAQREKEYGAEETERIPLLPGAQSGDIDNLSLQSAPRRAILQGELQT